nr:ACP S-malonyltransferase [Sedimentibacter sp.]
LEKQVYSPVRWEACVRKMIEDGVATFVEIGPGKTLSAFIRKIDKNVKTINIENIQDFRSYLQFAGA